MSYSSSPLPPSLSSHSLMGWHAGAGGVGAQQDGAHSGVGAGERAARTMARTARQRLWQVWQRRQRWPEAAARRGLGREAGGETCQPSSTASVVLPTGAELERNEGGCLLLNLLYFRSNLY